MPKNVEELQEVFLRGFCCLIVTYVSRTDARLVLSCKCRLDGESQRLSERAWKKKEKKQQHNRTSEGCVQQSQTERVEVAGGNMA